MPLLLNNRGSNESTSDSSNKSSAKCISDPVVNDINKCIHIIKTYVDNLNDHYIKCLAAATTDDDINKCIADVEKKVLELSKKASSLTVCRVKGCPKDTDKKTAHSDSLVNCITATKDRKNTLECLKGKIKPVKHILNNQ